MTMTSFDVHLAWNYPIVCQTSKEDFISIGRDVAGGRIISVNGNSRLSLLKSILNKSVHAHGRGFPFPEAACLFSRKSIYTPHNDTLGMSAITRNMRKFLYKRYDKIVVQTDYGKKSLVMQGIPDNKIHVLPNPVDYSFFSNPKGGKEFRKKFGLGAEPFVITVGIRPLKNPLVIADACDTASVKVVMVGPTAPEESASVWMGKNFNWYLPPKDLLARENVVLTGQLVGKDLLGAFDAASAYINSAEYETFGVAVYEAASAGLPLCLPNYGSFDAFRGAAEFHERKDSRKLAINIKKYIDDARFCKARGLQARKIAKEYEYPKIRELYVKFYKSVG